MGEMVEFPSNGKSAQGYLAHPGDNGPGVIVIQEWWGLNDHIKDVADRFASEGFVTLAPDLYHGKIATEPDEAGKMMMDLQLDQAARDMSGAFEYLNAKAQPRKIGATGFCMGGALALYLATIKPIAATVPFYGVGGAQPDWSKLAGPVLGHYAADDGFLPPAKAREIFDEIGKHVQAELHVYDGCDHAFFNDTRAEVYRPDAAKQAWERTISFLKSNLK